MLHLSRLPEKFWPYAYQFATYLHNRIPNKQKNNSTPIELMFGMKPSPSTLFHFGSKAIIQIPSPNQPKLDPRAYNAILVGYPPSSRGCIFYVPSNCSIVHSSHAVFPESLPTNKILDQQQSNIDNTGLIPELKIPNNIRDAMMTNDSTKWLEATKNELHQFDRLNVWTAFYDIQIIKVLGVQWAFALKRDNEGKIIKHKAQYVVKEFTQCPGQNFGDCYAPMASIVTLRLIPMLKVQESFIWQHFM
ncbi:hypothetical protein O181_001608 [Austropuccinia psidii MF-1]|uniref:Reverse transcriptase Ty1/copia-type domain-containing protein n=1 Tax=Austropuccinia psidii MF-1 TaxID=1389203 RepID=A0A9Q3BB46_9BASI|nr:hypothetical protein [Austropuccinia psidii MF-1]